MNPGSIIRKLVDGIGNALEAYAGNGERKLGHIMTKQGGWTAAAVVIAAVGAGTSIKGGVDAKSAAGKAGRAQALSEMELTNAKLIQLKEEERALRGQTIAGAAGSNIKTDIGSPLEVLKEQARNFQKERATVAKVGATKAANLTTNSKMVGNQAAYQGYAQGAQGLSNAFLMYSKMG